MQLIVKYLDNPRLNLLLLSDLHYGNRYTPQKSIDSFIQKIGKPLWGAPTRVIFAGDICEAKTRNKKGKQCDQIISPGKQLEYWQDTLTPYRDHIDAMIDGNHEDGIANEVDELNFGSQIVHYLNHGLDPEKDKDRLIKYDNTGIVIVYAYKRKAGDGTHTNTISLYIRHGHSSAATPGGKLNAAERGRFSSDAHIIFNGHVHTFTMTPGLCYRPVLSPTPKLEPREQWTVTNGSCLDYGGYGEAGGYRATPAVQTLVTIDLAKDTGPHFDIFGLRPNGMVIKGE